VALPAEPTAAVPETACTTGSPVTTAGYPIAYYAQATPSASSGFADGYQPDPRWASQHLVGTYVSSLLL
jgi:hypothetical protein